MGSPKKVSDDALISAYLTHGSVWVVAKDVGICGQSVYQRLARLGVINKIRVFSEEERKTLLAEYVEYKNKGKLDDLAAKMGRTKQFICRQAKKLGLTDARSPKMYLEKQGSSHYGRDHKRVRTLRGSPHKCEVCGIDDTSIWYDWANLTGKYDDPDDYKRMCRRCHSKYDKKNGNTYFFKINEKIRNEIIRLCVDGVPQKEIAEKFGISKSSVSLIAIKNGIRRKPLKRQNRNPDQFLGGER